MVLRVKGLGAVRDSIDTENTTSTIAKARRDGKQSKTRRSTLSGSIR